MNNDELLSAISNMMEQKLKLVLTNELRPLKEDVHALKEDVQTLKGDVEALKGDVQTLKVTFKH